MDANRENTLNFAHDALGQLTAAADPAASYDYQYDYQYDSKGNRNRRTPIATAEVTDYQWDHRNRLMRVTVKTNDQGPVTNDIFYGYDLVNRLARVTLETTDNGPLTTDTFHIYDSERWERGNAGDHLELGPRKLDQAVPSMEISLHVQNRQKVRIVGGSAGAWMFLLLLVIVGCHPSDDGGRGATPSHRERSRQCGERVLAVLLAAERVELLLLEIGQPSQDGEVFLNCRILGRAPVERLDARQALISSLQAGFDEDDGFSYGALGSFFYGIEATLPGGRTAQLRFNFTGQSGILRVEGGSKCGFTITEDPESLFAEILREAGIISRDLHGLGPSEERTPACSSP